MTISELAVKNKVTVYIFMMIIIIMGILSYTTIPKESSPSITIPFVFISTVYPGVSPEDIEKLVTQEIEKEVSAISDIKNLTSISQESFSSVTVEFTTNVKIEDALQKVRDKVSIAKTNMPSDIEEPDIKEVNLSETPILYINFSGNLGLAKLKDLADDMSDKIEGIPGVLSAEVSGGIEREVKINTNANRMKYYNVTFGDISNAVKNENLNIPGGGIDIGSSNFLVRTPGEYKDPENIKNIVIKSKNEQPIFLRDVAEITYGFEDRDSYSRENGTEAVTLVIKKGSGENIIEINQRVKELIEQEKTNFPEGVKVSFTGDESTQIENTVHELENGIITGMLLVTFVLLSAMGFRNALFVALAIPLSFLIAFSILAIFGVTMNMVVLFSLILVLGIIVDDAIVVTENIYRLQEKEGLTPYEAAIEGPKEVQMPVLIATFTIISAFAPLLFFPGIMGEFMKYLPITIITCLFSSLFVALVINPVFASQFINFKKDREKVENSKYHKFNPFTRYHLWFDRKFESLTHIYERFLRFIMCWRKTTMITTLLLLVAIFTLFGFFNNGVEYFPQIEPKSAFIQITTPIGTNIQKTNEVTKIIEQKLPEFKDLEYYITSVGQEISTDFSSSGGNQSNKSTITLNFYDKEEREQDSFATIEEIRNAVTGVTTADVRIDIQEGGPPTGPPVNIELSGNDFKFLGGFADKIKRKIKGTPGLTDLKDNFDRSRPELRFSVDREKAALYGLTTFQIASTIRTAVNGTKASTYRVGKNEYDITVRLDSNQRNDISSIQNLYIPDKDGNMIPLTSVATFNFTGSVGAIRHKDQKRVVTISGNVPDKFNKNEVLKKIQASLKDLELPSGYNITYTGEQEDQKESEEFLSKAFIITILLIFFFLVMEFNAISTPLIIMFTVVLSLIGVLIGLWVTGMAFGVIMTGIGVISLAGIVVRNAIVLLDFQKVLMERGLSREESTIQSGKIRMRPVVLTAVTTILGLVPLTTGVDFDWRSFSWIVGGENTAFWQPMGVAIIFGLIFATFLTLIVVPVMFVSVNNWLDRVLKRNKKQVDNGKEIPPDHPVNPVTT